MSKTLGRYELVEQMGQGGMGEVWLARLSGAGGFEKPAIVKTVLPTLAKDPQFVKRFHHEGKVLVHLSHANIAQVYDMNEVDGVLFMALEYVAGVDVAKLISQAKSLGELLPVPIALFIAWQTAEGLAYAHHKSAPDGTELAIVHRDISPQNVMISYDGEVKVIDFGIARSSARSHATQQAMVIGKLGYMSPQQALAEPIDARADQYALGVVLWELLAGKDFLAPGSTSEMLAAAANPKTVPLPPLRMEVDAQLDAVVRKAMSPSPENRYPTTDELARALLGELTRLGGPPTRRQVGEWVKRICREVYEANQRLLSRLSTLSSLSSPPPTSPVATPLAATAHAAPPQGVIALNQPAPTTDAEIARMRPSRVPLFAGLAALVVVLGAGAWFATHREEKPLVMQPIAKQDPTPAPELQKPEPAPVVPVVPPIAVEAAAIDAGTVAAAPSGLMVATKKIAPLFADGEKMFARAGSADGLKVGVELRVIGAQATPGTHPMLGVATVLEVFPKMARLNLDESAAKATGDRFVALDEAKLVGAPAATPEVVKPAEVKPIAPGTKVKLQATLMLVQAPKRAVRIRNTGGFTFKNCWVTIPGQQRAEFKSLPSKMEREIVLDAFTAYPSGPSLTNEVRLDCQQGSITLPAQ